MEYIRSLRPKTLIKLIAKANEKDRERVAWELWLSFDDERKNKQPYQELLDKFKAPREVKEIVAEEEIMNEAENILNMFKRT